MNIHHHVATIQQVNIDECWAAATAMAMRRHSVAGTNHVKSLANAAGVPLDNGTLPDSSVQLLARAVGLGWHDFQTREVTLPELARLLQRGPVVAFGFFNYPDVPAARKHAVVIFALVGDGTARHTIVKLIDPAATVNPFTDDWEDFTESVADITFLLSY
jgi:ABC-type bacteriocin/lantibiotic exporter with double-glycine peptidase domain